MKDIRIFVASSKELERERNELAFLVLSEEESFAARGLRVRLAKWEYVDPKMTEGRTEDRYLDEMYGCDAAFVLFRNVAGMYTREELDKALAREREGTTRLKAHAILFAADGKPDSDAARLRDTLPQGSYDTWNGPGELREAFLSLVDRVAECGGLVDAPPEKYLRKITAFLAADGELAEERNAFADTVLNVNDLLEQARRNIRVQLRFYDPANAESVLESSEMGLVLYGTNYRVFGRKEIEDIHARVKDGTRNPRRFYVFFRDLDEESEKSLDEAFKTFRSDFVSKLGHFTCQFGDANALRLGFLLSLERYAGESVELYSTVAAPAASAFVGREKELRRLCGLLEPVPGRFPAGRLPVVTGAGGTGKSELVRQYASQLRVQYPGGVFQVDMERRRTWDDAFLGLLDGIPNNGVPVSEYLELESGQSGGGESGKDAPPSGAEVRDALLKKARTAGPMLLVLDNVEGGRELFGRDGGFAKAFPSGFSERVLVNVVATARVCDTMLRPGDWAVPFPLGDLPEEAALELLLGDRFDADAAERAAAGRVAELLGFRALYLKRVPGLIGDLYAETVCDSYAELAKALEENLLGTVAEETEGTHLPDVLWNMTRERLLAMPLGTECLKLAQVASFFSPDGFPLAILRNLWTTVVAPGQDERKFARAVEILRHHNLFQSVDPVVRLHRLDRAAILQTAKVEPGLEDAVGKSLAGYLGMAPDDWLLLADHTEILGAIPEEILLYRERERLNIFSALSNPGSVLSLQTKLLCLNPAVEKICRFDNFTAREWVAVLERQPQFANRCPWTKLDKRSWETLLVQQPQLSHYCPWDELSGGTWAKVLRKQPQFANRCPWEKFDGDDWACLLEKQPQFADRCQWDKLDASDWSRLLGSQPRFSGRCPWEKFDGDDWACLLEKRPQFADRCQWDKLDASDWSRLLGSRPQFSECCPWEKFDGGDWACLLEKQPQFAEHCQWDKLDASDWSRLLGNQPQYANRCPWQKLEVHDWMRLIKSQPSLGKHCSWNQLDADDWSHLLAEFPQFIDQCPLDKLDGSHWATVLESNPQLAECCPWDKLTGNDWRSLLARQPQFANICPWEKLEERSCWPWASLLAGHPQFAVHCPWEKLDGQAWARLLEHQPQFAIHCPWEKLESRVRSRAGWLGCFAPQRIAWVQVLKSQPQFADRCPWEKLDGGDWSDLLCKQPQFADRCVWEKLDDRDWRKLLREQPQFAGFCPPEKRPEGME